MSRMSGVPYGKRWDRMTERSEQVNVAHVQFLTVAEVAAMMRVSTMTVYRLISAGSLPAVRVGKSYRLTEADVDRYLQQSYTETA